MRTIPVVLHILNGAAAAFWLFVLSKRLRYLFDKQDHGVMAMFVFAGLLSFPVLYILVAIDPIHLLFPQVYRG